VELVQVIGRSTRIVKVRRFAIPIAERLFPRGAIVEVRPRRHRPGHIRHLARGTRDPLIELVGVEHQRHTDLALIREAREFACTLASAGDRREQHRDQHRDDGDDDEDLDKSEGVAYGTMSH